MGGRGRGTANGVRLKASHALASPARAEAQQGGSGSTKDSGQHALLPAPPLVRAAFQADQYFMEGRGSSYQPCTEPEGAAAVPTAHPGDLPLRSSVASADLVTDRNSLSPFTPRSLPGL